MPRDVSTPTSASLAVIACLLAGPAEASRLRELLGDTSGAKAPPLSLDAKQRALDDIIFATPQNTLRMDMDRPVTPWGPQPYDWGGMITGYEERVRKSAGKRVEIRGTCISACTMLLGAKDVCVDKQAMLWFHAAYETGTKKISEPGNAALVSHWPAPVRDWAARTGALKSVEFTLRRALTGVELVAMGVPACK